MYFGMETAKGTPPGVASLFAFKKLEIVYTNGVFYAMSSICAV